MPCFTTLVLKVCGRTKRLKIFKDKDDCKDISDLSLLKSSFDSLIESDEDLATIIGKSKVYFEIDDEELKVKREIEEDDIPKASTIQGWISKYSAVLKQLASEKALEISLAESQQRK